MAESNGLLNRRIRNDSGGSNPPRSAMSYKDYTYIVFQDSSVLHSCAWAEDLEAMIIVFNSGAIWLYDDATRDVYQGLVNAESAGKYFNLNIRNTLKGNLIYKKGPQIEQEAQ